MRSWDAVHLITSSVSTSMECFNFPNTSCWWLCWKIFTNFVNIGGSSKQDHFCPFDCSNFTFPPLPWLVGPQWAVYFIAVRCQIYSLINSECVSYMKRDHWSKSVSYFSEKTHEHKSFPLSSSIFCSCNKFSIASIGYGILWSVFWAGMSRILIQRWYLKCKSNKLHYDQIR